MVEQKVVTKITKRVLEPGGAFIGGEFVTQEEQVRRVKRRGRRRRVEAEAIKEVAKVTTEKELRETTQRQQRELAERQKQQKRELKAREQQITRVREERRRLTAKEFERMAEFPFGEEIQRVPISEIKRERERRREERKITAKELEEIAEFPFGKEVQKAPISEIVKEQRRRAAVRELVVEEPPRGIARIKRRAEELEIRGIREGREFERRIGAAVSAVISPIDTPEELMRRARAAALGVGVGGVAAAGVALIPGAIVPVGLGLLAAGFALKAIPTLQEQLAETDPVRRREIIASLTADVAAFTAGAQVIPTVIKLGVPKRVEVTKLKEPRVALKEEIRIRTGKAVQEIRAKIIKSQRLTKTKVRAFERKVTPPKEIMKLREFITRKDIEIRPIAVKEGVLEIELIQKVPKGIRRFPTEPQVFTIKGIGKLKKTFERELVFPKLKPPKVKERIEVIRPIEIKRLVDPRKFEISEVNGKIVLKRVRPIPPKPKAEVVEIEIIARPKVKQVFDIQKSLQVQKALSKLLEQKAGRLFLTPVKRPLIRELLVPTEAKLPIVKVAPIKAPTRLLPPIVEFERKIEELPELGVDLKEKPRIDIIEEQKQREKQIIEEELVLEPRIDVKKAPRERIRLPIIDIVIPEPITPIIPIIPEPIEIPEREIEAPRLRVPVVPPLIEFPELRVAERLPAMDTFNVKVKEKGKFIRVNKEVLPRNKSLNVMADFIDNTPSATGKIIKTNIKKRVRDDPAFFKRFKFRKKDNEFVELERHRIDTIGELQGITIKGLKEIRKIRGMF